MLRLILVMICAIGLAACATSNTPAPEPAAHANNGAEQAGTPRELLGKMVGTWELRGEIAGEPTVHDVQADWALERSYVRISEISRERDEHGRPLYEAIIFVGWLESENRFVCFWFDNTEVANGRVTCSAPHAADTLPFEFRNADGGLIFLNTFSYARADDTWQWRMENISGEQRDTFGLVTLRRR